MQTPIGDISGVAGLKDGDMKPVDRPSMPLNELRDLAAERVTALIGKALERIKPDLLRVIDSSMGSDVYYLYMSALELVRDNQQVIERAYYKAYLRRFEQSGLDGGQSDAALADSDQLSLLGTDDLEESLARNSLANTIRDTCVEELFGLDKRIGLMINDPDLLRRENPLGPDVIARAAMDALAGLDASIKARLLVMGQLSKLLPEGVRDLYRDINRRLVDRNILPHIRVGLPRSAPDTLSSALANAVEMAETGESGNDLLTVFQRLIAMNNGAAGQAAGARPAAGQPGSMMPGGFPAGEPGAMGNLPGGLPGGMSAIDQPSLLESLNHLQHGQVDAAAWAGLDPKTLRDGRVNVLHSLRSGPMAQASALDTMTLDIVAMVFDYILDDARIPDSMKALIGRLQIPVLKVAMLDKTFFSKKSHPARRFLDSLAEAAIRLGPESPHNNEIFRKAEELVERLQEEFDDSVDIFTEVAAEMHDFLAGEQRKADIAMAYGIEAIKAREVAAVSAEAARHAVEESLVGHQVPLAIRVFIVKYWQRLLADIHKHSGRDGAAWKIAVTTMDNLVWSVEPKRDPVERASLVGMLPGLLKQLEMGADNLDIPPEERELFFATLIPCHTLALKSVMLENEVVTLSFVEQAAPVDTTESHDFEPLKETEVARPAPEVPVETAAEAAAKLISDTSAVSAIEGLELGNWIEYSRDDGVRATARLAWISPLKGIYMFTNNQDQSAVSITVRGLREKLRTGEVSILDDSPLMDRVVDNLMERVQ